MRENDCQLIKVYPDDAFVANSYKYRAYTSYFVARRTGQYTYEVTAGTCDAKRRYGAGAKTVVKE
jgi:hypothetical protein